MLYPSINELRKQADSKYTLVILAAKRARKIISGEPPLDASEDPEKPVSVAAREIVNEWITYQREEQ